MSADNESGKSISAQLMQNPELLAALQSKLDGLAGLNSEYIRSLPAEVKRRVKALKVLQKQQLEIEVEFNKEYHQLELKYQEKLSSVIDTRKQIIIGQKEPTDEESKWDYSDDEDDVVQEVMETKEQEAAEAKKVAGIPEFWFTILKSTPPIDQIIEEHDEPILEQLIDIRSKLTDSCDQMAFTLEFEFAENDFFENKVLTKTYKLQNMIDEDNPLGYEGPEIISCQGCKIDWKPGKNVTEKIVKKRQKHKGRGTVRTVEKKVLNDSFFNFFSPPEVKDNEELDSDTENLLDSDFQVGSCIKDRIVTRAVLYFTGEAQAAEREDDFDDLDGEGEDEDADYAPDGEAAEGNPECKQQ
ncbi:Oidioi.mRNA.OKI2018_I69.XSR.g15599.t1.cds [Oikopleura dioica]|uniref:Oidioi.mRNA.OKI2018_I69.XSR.g15599.t1.cds n=1 Tax=Oikopleura dioica TaxID=34765 RepID=A0ABN7SDC4_OIKDI|nr:Oidioi.mRNA.OKI2018_I69.XSR.g15599.t1.cds [Oikopleura dioica]